MGPSHGLHSFRNRVLQHVTLTGSKLLTSRSCSLYRTTGSAKNFLQYGPHMGSNCPSEIHALVWNRPGAVERLLHHGPPGAARAQLPHHGLYHSLQGDHFSCTWNTSHSSFTDLGVCRAVFSCVLTSLFACICPTGFCSSFLTILFQKCYHHHWWT